MSFLKISDPTKRDFIVDQFLKTKENIQKNLLSERMGEYDLQRELSKVFKPNTDTQKTVKEGIVSELNPITQSLTKEVTQKALTFPQFPSIKAYDEGEEQEEEEDQVIYHRLRGSAALL